MVVLRHTGKTFFICDQNEMSISGLVDLYHIDKNQNFNDLIVELI